MKIKSMHEKKDSKISVVSLINDLDQNEMSHFQ